MIEEMCVLIPAYCPNEKIFQYVKELNGKGLKNVLIVNDGSSSMYDPIFQRVEREANCEVIGYKENKGKGAALKFGFNYLLENKPSIEGVITADCDGQHTVDDVLKVLSAIDQHSDGLVLGVRNFSKTENGEEVPFRSRFGNIFSSGIFYLLYHRHLSDTQTGLRGFSSKYLPFLNKVDGDRYEYETQELIECVRKNIPFYEVRISTIYEENNSGSHFHPIKDSISIICTMFHGLFLFAGSSMISSVVDILLAWLFLDLFKMIIQEDLYRITLATILARLVSMDMNYILNKKVVFKDHSNHFETIIRYIFLCVIVMILSSLFVYLTSHYLFWNEKLAKIIGDCLLFFFSYRMQKGWIFNHE